MKVTTDYPNTDLYTVVVLLTFHIAHTLVDYGKMCMVPLVFHALTLYIVLRITCLILAINYHLHCFSLMNITIKKMMHTSNNKVIKMA